MLLPSSVHLDPVLHVRGSELDSRQYLMTAGGQRMVRGGSRHFVDDYNLVVEELERKLAEECARASRLLSSLRMVEQAVLEAAMAL